MEDAPRDWIETALKVTGHFEDSADPMGGVSGNFDGMGISLGVLQWNIGSGSLQPLVRAVGRSNVVATMPVYGDQLWAACTGDIPHGLSIVRSWQTGAKLLPAVRNELKDFTHSAAFTAQQIDYAQKVARTAFATGSVYARADPAFGQITKSLFCWFFDLVTQNGGLGGVGYDNVAAFIALKGVSLSDDIVCDWLEALPSGMAGAADARRNATLWRDAVPSDRISLFVLSYLRSLKAREQWRGDVLNRKGTIALGRGWVHTERHDLSGLLGD